MRLASLAMIGALSAFFASGGVTAQEVGDPPRALALDVWEGAGNVEVRLIANSPIDQQVAFQLELVGSSNARHSGDTPIAAGERVVLSRMRTGTDQGWCAIAEVSEASGARYTLTAGDCAQA